MAYPAEWMKKVTTKGAGFYVVTSKPGIRRRRVRRSIRSCTLCGLVVQGFHADSEHGPSHYWLDGIVEFLPERIHSGFNCYGLNNYYTD